MTFPVMMSPLGTLCEAGRRYYFIYIYSKTIVFMGGGGYTRIFYRIHACTGCGVCPFFKWLLFYLTELGVQRSKIDRGIQGKPAQVGLPMGLLLSQSWWVT